METTATTEIPVYERELQIDASPETVWEFLVDPEKVARWKGLPAMAFDPEPGGAYRIEIVPGRVASGAFVELERPRRLVYTWGWEPGPEGPSPVPPGTSTVEIDLEPVDGGTKLRFTHRDLPNVEAAQSHGEGWDHYLGRLVTAAQGGDPGQTRGSESPSDRAPSGAEKSNNEGSTTMGKYVYAYKGGGMPESEEEGKRVMEAWTAWFGGLGDSVVDIGNPFGASAAVGGGSTSGITGYSIVKAGNLDDALAKANGCPILDGGNGSVEVYETVDM